MWFFVSAERLTKTFPSSTFTSTVSKSWVNSPNFPFTVIVLLSTVTVTPSGMATGLFPILDF